MKKSEAVNKIVDAIFRDIECEDVSLKIYGFGVVDVTFWENGKLESTITLNSFKEYDEAQIELILKMIEEHRKETKKSQPQKLEGK